MLTAAVGARLIKKIDSLSVDASERQFTITTATPLLTNAGSSFLAGSRAACTDMAAIHAALADVPVESRGFAYEGAGMVAHILDRVLPGRNWRIQLLLGGVGSKFRYLTHVGVGWGMRQLRQHTPKTTWGLDPLLRWLSLDGLGFEQMYFARRHERSQLIEQASASATDRIVMQGRGRALWFTCGADIELILKVVRRRPETTRDALWRGVGLAAGYAGADSPVIADVVQAAPPSHAGALRQGLRFASAARAEGGQEDTPSLVAAVGDGPATERYATSVAQRLTHRSATADTFRQWQYTLEPRQLPAARVNGKQATG